MTVTILTGDCRTILRDLAPGSVDCVVTSPPYYGLRNYGVAGQIGLEKTPEAYVLELVEVFREVRRVLRDDGTLWLNLGDTYASGKGTCFNPGGNKSTLAASGLKPKDLIGIPWVVAKALQAPYYTGRIKDERDRVWLAAMIDGEGCMFLHRRKIGQNNGQGYTRKNDSYGAGLEVANTHLSIVERCLAVTGTGSICRQDKGRRQALYRWNLRSNECREIVREVYPYLVAKQHQARLLLGCPSSGPDAEAAHAGLIALHNGQSCGVDFRPPKSMYEQGWYLRQDIIWAKLNPMPESVTDRCTKSHEHIFLLTKAERYYFNAPAIAEDAVKTGTPGHLQPGKGSYQHVPHSPRQSVKRGGFNGKTNALPGREAFRAVTEKRNKRDVWTVAVTPFNEAHFATFPPELIEPCILAGCRPAGTVLDPFGGAGTTGLVADRLGRGAILIELNPAYAAMAKDRLHADAGMFAEVEHA